MLKNGNRIQLTAEEKAFLDLCAGTACNPQTEDELAAWVTYAKEQLDLTSPEERLLNALLDMLARNEFLPISSLGK